jgi:copper chaperone
MSEKTVLIPNISCGHCTATIEREINDLNGVTSVTANKDTKQVNINWNEAKIDWPQISNLLTEIGFPES